ncbi:MAG TPA: nuclear transport factor 2 family protein [Acidimicrobiales bacterium]|nr:nuclear transport factor 2 family protein [Acidimicrobiales bacterium]
MTDLAPLTEDEVKRFMERWYLDLLDKHAPSPELEACVAEDAEMRFPEVTVYGLDAFRDWYDRIVNTFFDEVHEITRNDVTVAPDGQSAEVKVDVNWQAKVWIPPAAKSQWIGFDAGQTHEVRRSPKTGEPMIQVYGVDTFVAMPGSSDLPVLAREVIGQYYNYVNAGDWDGWLTLMDDDLVVDEQIDGHVEGKSNILGIGDHFRKVYSKFLMHPMHIIVQGEQAAVIWQNESANAAGVPISAIGANYFQVKNGKITYMRTIHDTVPFKPMTDQTFDD